MMRAPFHLLLVSVMSLQPLFATAQELDLGDRLRNMSAEVERFRESLPENDRRWASNGWGGEQSPEEVQRARLRVRIRNLPPGTKITAVDRKGAQFVGELIETTAEDLVLWVKRGSGSAKVKTRLSYQELQTAVLPKWNGWMDPEEVQSLKKDQKVELLLMNGTKVKGRLTSTSQDEWVLRTGKDEEQRFSPDEVASVRKDVRSRTVKVAIIAGVVFGTLALMSVIMIVQSPRGWTGGLL